MENYSRALSDGSLMPRPIFWSGNEPGGDGNRDGVLIHQHTKWRVACTHDNCSWDNDKEMGCGVIE